MRRYFSFFVLAIILGSATLLLRAQPLPQPLAPGGSNDPFAPAPPNPTTAHTVPADPFAAPAAPALAAPVKPAVVINQEFSLRQHADFAAHSFLVNVYNRAYAQIPHPPLCEILFADESLGREVLEKMTPAERMVYHLDRPATIKFFAEGVTVEDLVPELNKKLQVNVELDRVPLLESAFDRAAPLEYRMTRPANLGLALRRLFHSQGLDYVRLQDTLLITTRTAFEGKMFVKTYNLDREMFRPQSAAKYQVQYHAQIGGGLGAGGAGAWAPVAAPSGNTGDDDPLVEIVELIKPDSWKSQGGLGSLHLDLRRSLLVVNQRQDVHDEIDFLLADLRKIARSNQQAIQANAQLQRRVVFRLKLPEKQGGPAQPLGGGNNFIPLEPAFTMKEVADLIKQQIEPHTWKDEKHSITILGECLIINQSEAVQTKIYQFLQQLGITREQFDENNRPFYGFS
jgi:hypothetical protein